MSLATRVKQNRKEKEKRETEQNYSFHKDLE